MINKFETDYKSLVKDILENGELISSRAGQAYTTFGRILRINMNEGFPILTGRKMSYTKAKGEFLWMFTGSTDTAFLHGFNINWWDQYANKDGDVGKVYGYQIRKWNGFFDQISYIVTELNNNSRRGVLTFWNPTDLKEQSLPPCYTTMTFVRIKDTIHMDMHLRSSDVAVGLGYDIMIGAIFLQMISNYVGCEPGVLQMSLANAHIYENNKNEIKKYLKQQIHKLPSTDDDGTLVNYKHGPIIKMTLNV